MAKSSEITEKECVK